MHTPEHRLGELLLHKGLITTAQLDAAIALQGSSGQALGEILRQQGLISAHQLNRCLRRQQRLRAALATAVCCLLPINQVFAQQPSTQSRPSLPAFFSAQNTASTPLSNPFIEPGSASQVGQPDLHPQLWAIWQLQTGNSSLRRSTRADDHYDIKLLSDGIGLSIRFEF